IQSITLRSLYCCCYGRTSTLSICAVPSICHIKTSYFESWRSVNNFNSRSTEIFVDAIQGKCRCQQMLTTFGTIFCSPWKRFLTVWAAYNSHSKSPYRVATFFPKQSVRERLVVCQSNSKAIFVMSGKLLHKGVQQLYNDIQRLATFQLNKAD